MCTEGADGSVRKYYLDYPSAQMCYPIRIHCMVHRTVYTFVSAIRAVARAALGWILRRLVNMRRESMRKADKVSKFPSAQCRVQLYS